MVTFGRNRPLVGAKQNPAGWPSLRLGAMDREDTEATGQTAPGTKKAGPLNKEGLGGCLKGDLWQSHSVSHKCHNCHICDWLILQEEVLNVK